MDCARPEPSMIFADMGVRLRAAAGKGKGWIEAGKR
jgi:hypothetical protein